MEIESTEHEWISDKLAAMGFWIASAMIGYVLAGCACIVWSVRSYLATGWDDMLFDWPNVCFGIGGFVALLLAFGLWTRARWAPPLGLCLHGALASWVFMPLHFHEHELGYDKGMYLGAMWWNATRVVVNGLMLFFWARPKVAEWIASRAKPV